jgi:tetratricopeptide (TPR) repeat protein
VSLWRRGESPQAREALDRALRSLPDDPGRWLDLGRLLARLGRTKESETVLAKVLPLCEHSLPDDPGRWLDLGRLLARLGRTKESETVLAKARSLCERRLARTPDDEAAAAALAELLPDAGESTGWTVLRPDVITSAGGATLTRLADGSVVAGGPNPVVDTYTVEARTTLAGITGLRLEALTDPSPPYQGPGRSDNGNFVLDGIRLSTVPESGAPVPVRLTHVFADYSQANDDVKSARGILDADSAIAWAIWPEVGRPHWAVFQTAQPFGAATGTRLRIELDFRTRFVYHALGRFRLSVTNRPVSFAELWLATIKVDEARDGRTRLGAAYALKGEWAPAAAVLERAVARPDATALDGFLLALARHHLGRVDEARSACDRALGRLGSDLADEATHDVAVEAIMTIRDLGVDAAASLLLDAAFPADPFAR